MPSLLPRTAPWVACPMHCSSRRTTRSSWRVMTMAEFSSGANASVNLPSTIFATLSGPVSLFVTSDEQIFVGSTSSSYTVERWTPNGTRSSPLIWNCPGASGLFVDSNNTLYCTQDNYNQILKISLQSSANASSTVIVGNGSTGSAPNMLNGPRGIFVTINFDLYVADCFNHRVQLFRFGERNATTVVGSGSNGTVTLLCPSVT